MATGPCAKLYHRAGGVDICGKPAGHAPDDVEHEGRWTGVKWVGGSGDTQVVTNLDTVGLDEPAA